MSSVKIGINGAEQTVNTGSELFSAGNYADKADVISGIFTRKIGKYALKGNAQTVFAKSYTSGGVTFNRIYTPTPVGAKMFAEPAFPDTVRILRCLRIISQATKSSERAFSWRVKIISA